MLAASSLLAATSLNWIKPLWLVAVGAAAVTGVMLGIYYLLVLFAPKVAAIARTTAKEAWAQPLFWVELSLGIVFLILAPFIPYNTFGEDVKMIKDTGLSMIRVLAIVLAVWTCSISVSEEIEGRTALTLLSKPVGRRQFIFGKFLGILAPVLSMFIVLGALFLCAISYKMKHESRESSTTEPTVAECQRAFVQAVPGLALGFMETAMLASIAVALSTRLPMLPNLVICGTIYVVGHLAPLLGNSFRESRLVSFFGQFIATVLPNLDAFDMQAAVAKDIMVPFEYLALSGLYCLLFCVTAMMLALFMFEDRDLA